MRNKVNTTRGRGGAAGLDLAARPALWGWWPADLQSKNFLSLGAGRRSPSTLRNTKFLHCDPTFVWIEIEAGLFVELFVEPLITNAAGLRAN